MNTERLCAGTGNCERRVTTEKAYCMPDDRIPRARGFRHWGKKQKIRSGTERGKNEWIPAHQSQNRKHANRDKTIHEHISRAHQPMREAIQQPNQPQPAQHGENMVRIGALGEWRVGISHQMLGSRSKYSSSSFLPPSPLPSSFSDSMNSMRSIHFTIL